MAESYFASADGLVSLKTIVNATRTTLWEELWSWERAIARALLLVGALAGMTLGTVAHAQIVARIPAQSAGQVAAPAPAFQAAGAAVSAAAPVTPAWPAHAIDDIALLFIESTGGQPATLSTPAGFVAVLNSPQATGAGTAGTRLTVFWARATSTAMASPTVANPGNHVYAQILTYRAVYASGNPWDVTGGGVKAAASTTVTVTGVTTTVANTLIVQAVARDNNSAAAAFSLQTNGNLTGIAERSDAGTVSGNGGGFAVWDGVKAAAGATGNTTATVTSSINAFLTVALRPATSALTITKPAGTVANDVMVASIGFRLANLAGADTRDIKVTPPAGWTLVGPNGRIDNPTSTQSGLAVYNLVAGAGEPANYTWTFSCINVSGTNSCVTVGFSGAAGGIVSFLGVDTTTPIGPGEEAGVSTSVAAATLDTPQITTAVGNSMLVTSHAIPNANTWQTPPTSGMTQAFQVMSGIEMVQVSYALQAAAGATGTKRATDLGPDANDVGNAHILALRPALVLNQSAYRLFNNADSTDVGSALAAQNTAATLGTTGATFRLRMLLHVAGVNLGISGQAFKLQFAVRSGTCDTAFSGEIYADVTAASVIAYNNNATPADGATLTANASDPTHGADTVVNQTYEELNNFTNSVAAINASQDGKWDFALKDNGAPASTTYCFRAVKSTGTVLETYTVIPEISTAPAVPTPGSFNAFETSTGAGAITGVIRTKVAGSAFSLDAIAISGGVQQAGFTDVVIVELLGNNTLGVSLDAQNCPTSSTLVQTVSPNPTITGGRSTVSFAAVANSWRDVRVRVRWPTASPTVTWCSTDNFAIRPNTLTSFAVSDTDWQTAGTGRSLTDVTFGAVTHKAGRPLSVRATAVNAAAAATTNYLGAPTATLTACVGAACTATFGTLTLATTFVAGQLTSDVASYNNVGSFALQLVDSTFASVDAADTTGDCTASGRYVCSATINVGRFVPDHFAVALNTPVFLPACGPFTYIGQKFNYATAPVITVTAQDFANSTTTLYSTAGSWFRITNASLTGKAYTAAVGTLDVSGLPGTDPVIVSAGLGTGTLTFGSGTGLFFTRSTPTAPASPYDADISLAINVIDADGAAYATNPARFGAATAGNGIAFSPVTAKEMRFGRMRLGNAFGSTLLDLPVPLTIEYYTGGAFAINAADNCTTLAGSDMRFGYLASTPNLVACETAINPGTTISFVNGKASITAPPTLTPARLIKPGSGNDGSVDIAINLNGIAGNQCTAVGAAGPAATNANKPWLQGNWGTATYDSDPIGRATFGLFKSADQFIYLREVY